MCGLCIFFSSSLNSVALAKVNIIIDGLHFHESCVFFGFKGLVNYIVSSNINSVAEGIKLGQINFRHLAIYLEHYFVLRQRKTVVVNRWLVHICVNNDDNNYIINRKGYMKTNRGYLVELYGGHKRNRGLLFVGYKKKLKKRRACQRTKMLFFPAAVASSVGFKFKEHPPSLSSPSCR